MTGTYEIIKALPGKGTDWPALVSALRAHYLAVYANTHNGAAPWEGDMAQWDAAKGVRELRTVAMEAANFAVGLAAQRSGFIPPSPETLAWGGFLGGDVTVWTDRDAEAQAVAEIAEIVRKVAAG